MARPPKQRQAEYREKLRRYGRVTITAAVTNDAANLLRQLAKEHKRTQGEVIALGLLLARQRLAQPSAPTVRTTPQQEDAPQSPPVAHEQPLAMRKSEARALAMSSRRSAPERHADTLPTNHEQELPAWWPANAAELLGRN